MTPLLALSRRSLAAALALAVPAAALRAQTGADPLPSWRDEVSKSAILAFIRATTTEGSADFLPTEERLAVFDNDGTLWIEQPIYTQLAFALARVREMAPQHPDWQDKEPFRSVIAGDMAGVHRNGEKGMAEIVAVTHTGMTPEAFSRTALNWLANARHPRFQQPYTSCVYQPMLEVLALFRAHGFRTCIVSGGTVDFMRPWAESVYGVLPEQVVGTSFRLRYGMEGGRGEVTILPQLDLMDDGPGKPAGIARAFGRRPVAAFGNSDGDYEMLQYTMSGGGRRLGMIVHHDDPDREFAYDRQSAIGRLARGLDDAARQGWSIISMQRDWTRIFPWSS